MSDGTLSVRRREPKASEAAISDLPYSAASLRAGSFDSFLATSISNLGRLRVKDKTKSKPVGDVDEFKVESKRKKRLREYDRLLKAFKYTAALDSVLRKVCHVFLLSFTPFIFVSIASPSDDNVRSHPRTNPPRWFAECSRGSR